MSAHTAFALATVAGAEAAGLGALTGSIEVGKAADLVVLDVRDLSWSPQGAIALQLVWCRAGSLVRDVLVDGRIVMRDRKITTVEVEAVRTEVAERSAALLRRAGIEIPHRWPRLPAGEYRTGEGARW